MVVQYVCHLVSIHQCCCTRTIGDGDLGREGLFTWTLGLPVDDCKHFWTLSLVTWPIINDRGPDSMDERPSMDKGTDLHAKRKEAFINADTGNSRVPHTL